MHLHPYLLKLGRCTHWVDPSLSAEEKEAVMTKLGEEDAEMDRLKPIAEDKGPYPTEGGDDAENLNWIVKEAGDL